MTGRSAADKVGMHGTSSFGAGRLRFLPDYGLAVTEADRPDRDGATLTFAAQAWQEFTRRLL